MHRKKNIDKWITTGEALFPGFYFMLVSAGFLVQSCVYHSFSPANCDANPIVLNVVSIEDTECALQEGRAEVAATGGSGTYRFRINDGEEQSASFFSGLAAGVHLITAVDDSECSTTIEVVVMNKDGMNLTYESTDSGCQGDHGSITVTPVDGVPPYDFKINNGSYQSDNTFSHLSSGQYTVTVNDATGCEVSLTTRVKSGISFSDSVQPIIESNCIKSGCHNGSQFPNFTVFQNIKDNASRIKEQVVSRNMPEDGTLTQFEINSIVCWVDDGAPDN